MPFLTKNFNVDEGATLNFTIFWKDPNDVPINITGYTAKMQARDKQGGKILCFTLTHIDGISINGPLGRISVTVSAERTTKLVYPKSFYDLVLTAPDGVTKTRILEGTLSVSKAVTV
jgi:hypothetical protein